MMLLEDKVAALEEERRTHSRLHMTDMEVSDVSVSSGAGGDTCNTE